MLKYLKDIKQLKPQSSLNKLKDLGFKYSTVAGVTVSIADVVRSDDKHEIIERAKAKVDKINKQYQKRFNN